MSLRKAGSVTRLNCLPIDMLGEEKWKVVIGGRKESDDLEVNPRAQKRKWTLLKDCFEVYALVPSLLRKEVGELAGIAVGATVMLIMLTTELVLRESMNSARTLNLTVTANNYKVILVYLIAPILGALGEAKTYIAVKLPEKDDDAKAKASLDLEGDLSP
ncbi:hypothetical protein Fmac_020104 [Flemingia macrophylla]|uniref:Uncharacterized protein n=1 Tax=Flemingia macrophylla TaxID=520843 RepID=A0ABD1MAI0_9FABA